MDQLGQTGFLHVATGYVSSSTGQTWCSHAHYVSCLLVNRETDADGRNNSLLPSTLKIDKNAIYKMTFYTREYFSTKGVESFYPFVEVVFEVKEPDEHHHIALLLSPYSYTTYRGS
jgi:5-hydroxyisourate hydrolase